MPAHDQPKANSLSLTREYFAALDRAVESRDQIAIHVMKRLIEGRPQDDIEIIMDERLGLTV